MGNLEIHNFESEILGRKRKVRVYTPTGYEDGGSKKFPLLVQQDGQLAFTERDEELPYGSWGVDEWIEKLAGEGEIQAPVVIGIDNSPKRMVEYFPVTEEFEKYERFVLEEVLPWARENYNITDEAAESAVMGSSMGGLVSFALASRNPEVFGNAGCLSPWFEYENNRYIHEAVRKFEEKPPVRVYMDSGISDWRGLDDGHRGMLLVKLELIRLGFKEGEDLDWMVDTWFPTETDLESSLVKKEHRKLAMTNQHSEFHWRRRLERPLKFLFRIRD